ncbi:alpha/beta fold hydrolase [Streptomyces xiaopingdaonensis]|uniref:alpha/beta fold hydrolase n=1 Tax=Streptomyces xiaopingdaonensis TaxID=1565415 RepID=UPI00030DD751|nr:alpha/beta hydrolase [Streptomyces xiaopingdaonensis]
MAGHTDGAEVPARTARIGDLDVTWSERGRDGAPVVFLHGLAEDRHTWSYQQNALQDLHTYAYDLRGHGDTTAGGADGTLSQLGGDLIGFLDAVTGPATCVGFSLGGTAVLRAAAHRPDLLPHPVVFGTSTVVGRAAAAFYEQRQATAESGDRAAIEDALREDSAGALVRRADLLERVVASRMKAVGGSEGYLNGLRAMRALREEPLTPLLEKVTAHVDVAGGEFDSFCPRKAADIILANLPDATYHEVPGVGHLMNADDPAAVTTVLRTILAR